MKTTRSADDITSSDIVVGLDPMQRCRPVVSWAIDAARSSGRRVVLLRAVDLAAHRAWLVEGMLDVRATHLYRPAVRREVERARLEAGPGVEIRGLVRTGRPHAAK